MDDVPEGSGWVVAVVTVLLALAREYVRGRDQHAVAREQGAAAVVPELLERLDRQDARLAAQEQTIAGLRADLDAARALVDECEEHRSRDRAELVAMRAHVHELQRVIDRMTDSEPPPSAEPQRSLPPPLPAHIRSTREEPIDD